MVRSSRITAFVVLILLSGLLYSCSSNVPPVEQSPVATRSPLVKDNQAAPSSALPQTCEERWAHDQDPSNGRWTDIRPLTQLSHPPPGETSCWTWADERHLFKPARLGWLRYTNERFGFSIEVPADWYEDCPPINGDGLSISSPDGLASISFYGFMNVMEGSNAEGLLTLEEYMDKYIGNRGQPIVVDGHVGREVIGPNPYRAPGEDDGCYKGRRIVLLGLESGRGIILIAPRHVFEQYNGILNEMLRTYRAGNLD